DGVADDDVAGGFFDDGQGLEDGHAAADEGAEGAGEARDGDLVYDRADDRHLQFELVPNMAAKFGFLEQDKEHDEYGHAAEGHEDIILDRAAHAQDQAREGRQLGAFGHAEEHLLEGGNNLDHQNNQDAGGNHEDRDRVKHGRDHLSF